MMEQILFYIHGAVLLMFGVYLSFAFAGIGPGRKNIFTGLGLCAFSGAMQIAAYLAFSESIVWKLYPLIAHLPVIVLLAVVYRKKVLTAVVSLFTAYLCCQPAKWFGVLVFNITENLSAEYITRILVLVAVAAVAHVFLVDNVAQIFSKDDRSVMIFGIIPVVYYLFDYATAVYSGLLPADNRVIMEFMPFFLCIVFMLFCVVYHKEYEQRADAQRKENIIQITVEEQRKEIEAIRDSAQKSRILRHDMRLFLNNLLVSIDNNDKETARKMISGYVENIDEISVKRYCHNITLNYIISSFARKCEALQTEFVCMIEVDENIPDEIILSSIISNALDNAINAQKLLPKEKRKISLMMKNSNGRLLLSVKNPFRNRPLFSDGLPATQQPGHGYGTQSIAYLTEKLGGNCQFVTEDSNFVLRVVI